MAYTCSDEHPAERNLQPPPSPSPSQRLDRDAPLAGDRRAEPLGEPHRLRDGGGIGELIVPLFERVAIRPDTLGQDLVHERRQRGVRPAEGAEILYLIHEAPQLLGIGIVRGPAPGECAYRREEVAGAHPDRRLDFLKEMGREHAPSERLERDRIGGIAHDP